MRGISSTPFVAFIGTLAILIMFSPGVATQSISPPAEPQVDIVVYAPQSAPADEAQDLTGEDLFPSATPEVGVLPASRRASSVPLVPSRRVTAALTLFLATRLNTPGFRASLGSIPQSGTALGLLPGVAVANGKRTQGDVPVRRHLARRRAPTPDTSPQTAFDPKVTAFYGGETLLLH